jgi:hypothetical protein
MGGSDVLFYILIGNSTMMSSTDNSCGISMHQLLLPLFCKALSTKYQSKLLSCYMCLLIQKVLILNSQVQTRWDQLLFDLNILHKIKIISLVDTSGKQPENQPGSGNNINAVSFSEKLMEYKELQRLGIS